MALFRFTLIAYVRQTEMGQECVWMTQRFFERTSYPICGELKSMLV